MTSRTLLPQRPRRARPRDRPGDRDAVEGDRIVWVGDRGPRDGVGGRRRTHGGRPRRRPGHPGLRRRATCTPSGPASPLDRARPDRRASLRRTCSTRWPRTPPRRPATRSSWSATAGTRPAGPSARPPTGAELDRAAPGRRGLPVPRRRPLRGRLPRPARRWRPAWRGPRRAGATTVASSATPTTPCATSLASLDRARASGWPPPGPRCRAWPRWASPPSTRAPRPHIGPEHEIDTVRRAAAAETGLRAVGYWGELTAVEPPGELGVAGLAGDLFADGAFGSRTAALARAVRRPGGHLRARATSTPTRSRDHVVACTRAGVQAGFHCIGDAALDAIGDGFARPPRQSSAPTRWCAPGTGSSTSRCRRPRPSPRCAGSGSWPACSRRSTGSGAARPGMYAAAAGGAVARRPTRSATLQRAGGPARLRLGLAGHAARTRGRRCAPPSHHHTAAQRLTPRPRSARTPAAAGAPPATTSGAADRAARRRRSPCGTLPAGARPAWPTGCPT